jgi:AraC family transcriptional regulator, ethanolamine operon transcriptional activator
MSTPLHPPPSDRAQTASGAAGWTLAVQADDVDDLAAAQRDWTLRYDQLSGGRFDGRVDLVQLPGLCVVREVSTRAVHQRGQLDPRSVGFALGRSSCGPAHFHGQQVQPGALMIGCGDALDLHTPEQHELIAIVVDRALLSAIWQRLYQKPWSPWLDEQRVVPARPGMADAVRTLHLDLLGRVARDPGLLRDPSQALPLRDALLIEWLEAIPERVEPVDLRSIAARRRVVERVCDQVLGQPEEAPTLLQLCRDIGVSPRKLDYCFRDLLGMPPARYLRALRLNGARRALKRADGRGPAGDGGDAGSVTVHDVAVRWGFWHMGAFSADYKRQFGELPSVTRQRGRAAAG